MRDHGRAKLGQGKHQDAVDLFERSLSIFERSQADVAGPGVYPGISLDVDGRQSFDGFMANFEATEAAAALAESMSLDFDDAEFGFADGPDFDAFHGDCEGAHSVVHFPDEGVVLDVHTLFCSG